MSKRMWLLTLALSLLAVLAAVAWRCWPRTVPLSQCSEVYRRYHDTPGIQASFIKNKQINDTLRLDMTLFEADDSASFAADSLAFANMLKSMGKSDEYITDILSLGGNTDKCYSGTFRRRELGSLGDSDDANNEVRSVFPVRMTVAIFHTRTAEELKAVLQKSYYSKIKIEDSI